MNRAVSDDRSISVYDAVGCWCDWISLSRVDRFFVRNFVRIYLVRTDRSGHRQLQAGHVVSIFLVFKLCTVNEGEGFLRMFEGHSGLEPFYRACTFCLFFFQEDFKTHELPLARIKKIMRLEDDVAEMGTPRFMIAAEAPIIIAKACEIFILEVGGCEKRGRGGERRYMTSTRGGWRGGRLVVTV